MGTELASIGLNMNFAPVMDIHTNPENPVIGSRSFGSTPERVSKSGAALIKGLHQYYVHSNIDWNHGPFKMLLVSPQFHRWHHAAEEAAWDKNFASIFPFLDKIFGTYYYPGTAVNTPTGFEGTPGHDIVELLFYPFKEWSRMIKAKFAKTDPVAPLIDVAE